MHLRRIVWLVLFIALLAAAAVACGREVAEARTEPGDASLQPLGSTDAGDTSACRACQAATCRNESAACAADRHCAQFLACRAACPVDDMGQASASCVAGCTPGDGAIAALITDLVTCESAANCASCLPTYDAGVVDAMSCLLDIADGDDVPCVVCEVSRCCTQHLACAALDGGCAIGRQCLVDCFADGGSSCYTDCYAQAPEGTGTFAMSLRCASDRCAAECGSPPVACARCLGQYCPRQQAGLASTVQNSMLEFCLGQCHSNTTSCYEACEQQFPDGVAAFNEWEACGTQFCSSVCNGK